VGRNKDFPDRITLPLAEGVKDRLDAARAEGEARLDVIRKAIDAELFKRERRRPKKP
jgi:hypothetical protein